MKCKTCGTTLPADVRLCPQCGTLQPSARATPPDSALTQPLRSTPGRAQRIGLSLAIGAGFGCALLAMLLTSGVAGFLAGQNDRLVQRQAEATEYFQQGLTDLQAGNLELAVADFTYVLRIDPDYPAAAQHLQEARQRITDRQRVEPTPTTSLADAIRQVFTAGRAAHDAQQWETAISRLKQVRGLDPAFETETVNTLLFNALYQYGLQLLKKDRLEEGVYHLEQAAQLRPLDGEAALQVELAERYLTARGYWGADWDSAIQSFGDLYNLAPGYRDTFDRYVMAHVEYADSYIARGDFCPAEPLLRKSLALRPDVRVQAQLEEAAAGCATATPVPLTGTLTISGTPVSVPGIRAGRLAYPVYDDASGIYVVYTLSPGGAPFAAAVGGQPAWHPNAPRLAYRVLGSGINILDLTNGQAALAAPAASAWPTWSPDGGRIAYAARDASGSFRIAIIPVDGSAPPVDLGPGKYPTWGPGGLLAYSGCDASGCGILVDNPDDPDPPIRLTASPADIPTSWSPDGFNISYFSDADGDWDVYFVNTAGGVQQVTNSDGNDGMPAWSPDGAHLAFTSNRDGEWAIYTVKFDGTEVEKAITLGPQYPNWENERLAWAP